MVDANRDDTRQGLDSFNRVSPYANIATDDAKKDQLLLRHIAANDTQAFDDLYRKYKPRLERYLAKHLNELVDIEEACNDVMLVVWNKATQFQSASKVSTWIFGIARIEVRRIRARTATSLDEPLPDASDESDGNTPEVLFDVQEHATTLKETLAALPLSLRLPVKLFYFHDYSYAQIAAHINCSESTIKSRLQQARRRLKVALKRANHQLPIAG